MLILFTASTSRVVVFAFECSELGHLHFSIFHKVTCADYENEICYDHINIDNCCCEDKKVGTHYIKILSLDIDINIVKKHIEKISVPKHFIPNYLSVNNNYISIPDNNFYLHTSNLLPDISLQIVKYIKTITANISEDPFIFN